MCQGQRQPVAEAQVTLKTTGYLTLSGSLSAACTAGKSSGKAQGKNLESLFLKNKNKNKLAILEGKVHALL